MKKVLAIVLTLALVLSMFAACGSSKPAPTEAAPAEAATTAVPEETKAEEEKRRSKELFGERLTKKGDNSYVY